MTRTCDGCGTEFRESVDSKFDVTIMDPIPECWKGAQNNGVCINCCPCNHES